jgi:hypothetical protein
MLVIKPKEAMLEENTVFLKNRICFCYLQYGTIIIIIQFNSVHFFIISVLHRQPEGQLQMEHKKKIINTTK